MKKNNKIIYKVNSFYKLAERYVSEITSEALDNIKEIDMTQLFYQELNYMVKHGEIIKLNINGKMRLGKSTVAMSIGNDVFNMIVKNKQKPKGSKFGMRNIARDQQEYSKKMRDPELSFTVIVVDEDNELEKTGENSTTEGALGKVQSDIQAGRYVHDIKVSPKGLNDDNADLILDVISRDKEHMINHCLLYYRFQQGLREHTQLMGYVDVYVGNVIHNWINNVMPIHKKQMLKQSTEKENKWLEDQRKNDWYVEYYLKKMEKMDLMNKEGIFRPRMLDNAEVYLKIINELKPLTKLSGVVNDKLIRSYIKMEFRKKKIPLSIVGEVNSTQDVSSILNLYISRAKLHNTIKGIEKQINARKISPNEGNAQIDTLIEMRKSLDMAITTQINELEHFIEINKKYNNILT